MTEATQVNAMIRNHLGPLGLFRRLEHSHESGWPDWVYRLRGRSGWIEAKLIPANRQPPKHFTLEQLRWGEEEVRHGGAWFLLGLCENPGVRLRSWLLYDAPRAREWFDGTANRPLVDAAGRFPTAEIVRFIAPRPPVIASRAEVERVSG